ncbi:RNA polymerase subunit sigma-70 [Bremerella cremea]|uniref:RNA polymerase subunit sigma-70 n=1 Tax=Blastopirellula marina TaxID=124 RepID=A0A2S8FW00_9BACT|nr:MULTISPECIES: sigma-70 family RNA polymerase sigma factor [Pirellulaceae]PQO36355.1 RNA polymerase subunit sigma-70 [Blastopirellula marina]RCS49033.1 RNA polymerase subunit sigma-70 [Bremerella cremea]
MTHDLPVDAASDRRYADFLAYFSADCERLHAYIYSLLPHHADADDVFQRCSLLLWKKFETFDHDRDFLSWACGVAFYEVKNFLRTAQRDRLQFSESLLELLAQQRSEEISAQTDHLAALRLCVKKLTEKQQQLVWNAYGSASTLSDLATASGRSAQTLYNQLATIRRKLAQCVQSRLAVEGGEQ